jgi:hypothetical protein
MIPRTCSGTDSGGWMRPSRPHGAPSRCRSSRLRCCTGVGISPISASRQSSSRPRQAHCATRTISPRNGAPRETNSGLGTPLPTASQDRRDTHRRRRIVRPHRRRANTSRTNCEDSWQPLDPNADDGSSEFSWADGLTPKGLENAPGRTVACTRARARRARTTYAYLIVDRLHDHSAAYVNIASRSCIRAMWSLIQSASTMLSVSQFRLPQIQP